MAIHVILFRKREAMVGVSRFPTFGIGSLLRSAVARKNTNWYPRRRKTKKSPLSDVSYFNHVGVKWRWVYCNPDSRHMWASPDAALEEKTRNNKRCAYHSINVPRDTHNTNSILFPGIRDQIQGHITRSHSYWTATKNLPREMKWCIICWNDDNAQPVSRGQLL